MAKIQHLENAPIREALIDIQVEYAGEVTVDSLRLFGDEIKDQYPKIGRHFEATVNLDPEEPTGRIQGKTVGYKFISDNGMQIAQARLSGFTFNRLKAYETWENLRGEAQRLWEVFRDKYKPIHIQRVGCRYINEIKLDFPLKLDEYITALPPKIKGLPDRLEGFLTRVEVRYDDVLTKAIVSQSLRVIDENSITLLLDIDVFRQVQLLPGGEEAWSIFEEFRDIKNEIFFNSITEKTVEQYK